MDIEGLARNLLCELKRIRPEKGLRLYERAVRCSETAAGPLPIWHVDAGRALFVGPLGRNAPHAHSVPVYLAGLYEPFRLRIAGGSWRTCRTAVIPAGLPYEFDVAGQPLAVLYLEPSEAGAEALAPLATRTRDVDGALVGRGGELSLIREVYEAPDGASRVGTALDDLMAFAKARGRRTLDPRISQAVARLSAGTDDALRVAEVARAVGLSPSRFQHIFVEEVGVPFRRFRLWQRLRAAIAEIAAGASFTDAAHRAGFFDQAHFARTFRQTFGAPASPSLRRVRRG